MVRDHPVVHLARPVRVAGRAVGRGLDQRPHQVGVIIVVLALQQRADPFQPHAGVDRLHVQRPHRAICELFVLHEDVVPDLDEPVAILVGAARRAAPDMVAVVIEDLGAGAAGAGRTHAPEIVVGRDADDPVLGQACDLLPDRRRLVIGMIDGDQQAVLVQPEFLCQQVPGKGNRVILEIVAKAEIPQHFKEGMVARGIAHIVQIVVLAARAHAFLRRCGPLVIPRLDPGEQVLELHHARIREHQRRIIARHQRRTGHDAVAVLFEEAKEGRSDVVQAGHLGRPLGRGLRAASPLSSRLRPVQQLPMANGRGFGPGRPVSCGMARRQLSVRSADASSSAAEKSTEWLARIASSIFLAMSGLSFRKVFAFSRPCPIRSSP